MQLVTSSQSHLVSVSMVQSGLYTMFLISSFGHLYQNVYVLVPVQYLVNVAVPPVVKQNVSTVMFGNAQGPTVKDGAGNGSVMTSITAASVPAASPAHIVSSNSYKDNEQKNCVTVNVYMHMYVH